MAFSRNYGWDSLKGFLILLVIIGHVVPEPLDSSLIRSIIYSFHMPLFIFLSGYLFPLERWLSVKSVTMLFHYKWRIIVPWSIAVFVFCGLCIYVFQSHQNPLLVLIRHFITPYFHLWFVPSLLMWMWATRLLYGQLKSFTARVSLVLVVSIVFFCLSYMELLRSLPHYFSSLEGILSTFRMQYWIFFVWGVVLKEREHLLSTKAILRWIYPLYFLLVIVQFYAHNGPLGMSIFFIANLILLFQVGSDIAHYHGKGLKWLNFLGRESMGFYLWHYVCTMLIKFWIGIDNIPIYYCSNVLGLILTFVLLYFLTLNKWTHQWLMGVTEKK